MPKGLTSSILLDSRLNELLQSDGGKQWFDSNKGKEWHQQQPTANTAKD
jgi:hypothetical protein